ncbi:hypothetical protein BT69DRAFT_1323060 [Atractiella rhizophila]|nr:hypothetical protein BT69DRAFT_1323060 [Atractiella rhizophila]
MLSFASVISFAARVEQELPVLDAAILNAGLATTNWTVSPNGWESTLQVNALSTTLLGILLLPSLRRTADQKGKANLTFVSSDVHMHAIFPEKEASNSLSALNVKPNGRMTPERYSVSKLLLQFAFRYIAQAAEGRTAVAVVVNTVQPGFCKSELLSREEGVPLVLRFIQWLIGRTTEEGAKTLVHAAQAGKETHGRYLEHQTVYPEGGLAASDQGTQLAEKCWNEILAVLEELYPDLMAKLG